MHKLHWHFNFRVNCLNCSLMLSTSNTHVGELSKQCITWHIEFQLFNLNNQFPRWQTQQLFLWCMWISPWRAWDIAAPQYFKLLYNFHLSTWLWLVEQCSGFCWRKDNGWDWIRELMVHFVQGWSVKSCPPVLLKYCRCQWDYNKGKRTNIAMLCAQLISGFTNGFMVMKQSCGAGFHKVCIEVTSSHLALLAYSLYCVNMF